jgi:hypothetical protein
VAQLDDLRRIQELSWAVARTREAYLASTRSLANRLEHFAASEDAVVAAAAEVQLSLLWDGEPP